MTEPSITSDIRTSDSTSSILLALSHISRGVSKVEKNAKNPHFGSSYANLEACKEVWDPIVHEHGCILIACPGRQGNVNTLTTRLWHVESGEWIEFTMGDVSPKPGDAQKIGSMITYFRRYGGSSLFGLVQVDDDGEDTRKATEFSPEAFKAEMDEMYQAAVQSGVSEDAGQGAWIQAMGECKLTKLTNINEGQASKFRAALRKNLKQAYKAAKGG